MNNTFFVICFKWIKNNTGMNLHCEYLKDRCIVKVSAESIDAAYIAVKASGFSTDGNTYVEHLSGYIRAYERHLAEGVPGYYAI